VKDLEELLVTYGELFGPHPVDGCAMEPGSIWTGSSRRLLAFSTHKGKYEWCRLPFRVVMGPMVFQERIGQIMEWLNWNYVLAYIDDIIVIRKKDYESHLKALQQVLERLRRYRLMLRREKFSFACKEVKYLGHQVSTLGIAPQYEYLDRIRVWTKPQSRNELRAYLRLFSFLSMFSPCTCSVLRPLQNLVGKKEIGLPKMISVLKPHSYSSMDKSHFTSTSRPRLKFTLMPVLMGLGEFLFRMTNQFGVYLHR
jgi:hypothetical protein